MPFCLPEALALFGCWLSDGQALRIVLELPVGKRRGALIPASEKFMSLTEPQVVTNSVEWAAWAQFAAGLLAVIAAIVIPFIQRKHQIDEEKRSQEQLRILMVQALRQPIGAIAERSRLMAKLLNNGTAQTVLPPALLFVRAPEFDQFRPHLHLLGETGHKVNRLIGLHAEATLSLHVYETSGYDQNHLKRTVDDVNALQRDAQECSNALSQTNQTT